MLHQRRISKSKAIHAIEIYNTSGEYERPVQNVPYKSVLPPPVRMSFSNVKKKMIVDDYINQRFIQTEIINSKGKGNGVRLLEDVESSGVLIVEYKGDLINKHEAERREKLYRATSTSLRPDCYLFYFDHCGKVLCVDPTIPSEEFGHGRYINHKVAGANLDPIKITVEGVPRIVLISNRPISKNEELFFDYGDRSQDSLTYFPWLRSDYNPMADDDDDDQNNVNNNNIAENNGKRTFVHLYSDDEYSDNDENDNSSDSSINIDDGVSPSTENRITVNDENHTVLESTEQTLITTTNNNTQSIVTKVSSTTIRIVNTGILTVPNLNNTQQQQTSKETYLSPSKKHHIFENDETQDQQQDEAQKDSSRNFKKIKLKDQEEQLN
ncbi:OTU domain containin protein [Tieghemostelium lacteum]|uniref:OTU domain containin protein n=1 Tax=Tieghemostelium lacteum TaxID=361077 RepID=A0A151Z5A2_TIELA|nr:OTU domain containin protein [Tieghemostelium lacteum]|eukprot:KYQ89153.1 OTU domain containin protein [Tieghemostelium lacteum]